MLAMPLQTPNCTRIAPAVLLVGSGWEDWQVAGLHSANMEWIGMQDTRALNPGT